MPIHLFDTGDVVCGNTSEVIRNMNEVFLRYSEVLHSNGPLLLIQH